jgi:hypothetical protein
MRPLLPGSTGTPAAFHLATDSWTFFTTNPTSLTTEPTVGARQVPVMQFRSLIGPAIVRSVSKPSPVPRMVTVP